MTSFLSLVVASSGFFYVSLLMAFIGFFLSIISLRGKLPRGQGHFALLYMFFFIPGFMFMFEHEFGDVVRDLLLLLKNILYLYLGVILYRLDIKGNAQRFLFLILIYSFLEMSIYLIKFLVYVSAHSYSIGGVRDNVGHGSILPVYGCFSLMLLRSKLKATFLNSRKLFLVFLTIFVIYLLATASRTLIISVVIFILIVRDWLWIDRFKSVIAALVVSLVLISLYNSGDHSLNKDMTNRTLMDKMSDSLAEMLPSDFDDDSLIHKNWRAYESFRGLLSFFSASDMQKVFGQGYGTLIDVDFEKRLSGSDKTGTTITDIPWMHNAYIYVLVKNGIVGFSFLIIMFLYIYLKILKYNRLYVISGSERSFCYIALFSVLHLFFSTFIDGGLINRWDSSVNFFILGISLAFLSNGELNERVNNPSVH